MDAAKSILKYAVNIPNVEKVCDLALNGKEALEMVINNAVKNKNKLCDYHLIMMDCNMPIMDGYEATSLIR